MTLSEYCRIYKGKIITYIILIHCILFTIYFYILEPIFKKMEQHELIEASLVEVVDGDTIKVELDGEVLKVRLIGVNAPESVHADESLNSELGKAASNFTKDFFEDYTKVYLQYDKDRQDQYGRELCYVWLDENVDVENEEDIKKYMYNAILVKNGYATDESYRPNTSYSKIFYKLCNGARNEKKGLWQYEK